MINFFRTLQKQKQQVIGISDSLLLLFL